MDKIKEMANKVGSGSGSTGTGTTGTTGGAGAPGTDYGDKGIAALEKKTGHNLSAEQNEKITDGGRNFIEKQTGKNIPDKFSN